MTVRVRSVQLGLSTRSLRRITNHLKLHLCKIQLSQELQIADHQKRFDLARDFLQLKSNYLISRLIMSDEDHFYFIGHVNKQNPRIIHEHLLHPQKVTVWCGMIYEMIIGPHFIEDNNIRTATVTGDSYGKCIQEYLLP